jgi:hypothetical protein
MKKMKKVAETTTITQTARDNAIQIGQARNVKIQKKGNSNDRSDRSKSQRGPRDHRAQGLQ